MLPADITHMFSRRFTTASYAQKRNASHSSKALANPFGMLNIFFVCEAVDVSYDIGNIFGIIEDSLESDDFYNHHCVINVLTVWLKRKISESVNLRSCSVSKNCSLGNVSKAVPQPFTSQTKLLDVGLYLSNGNVIAQFEVVSSQDYDGTVMKLAYGLCDQLRFIMNHRVPVNAITSVKGFIIPVCKTECVKVVECLWDNVSLSFKINCTMIQETDVWDTIVVVAETNKDHYDLIEDLQNMRLSFPIVIDDNIRGAFGNDVSQLQSGYSIVLACNNSIYKTAFNPEENGKLVKFVEEEYHRRNILGVCFPTHYSFHSTLRIFLKFPKLLPPFSRNHARQQLRFFTISTSLAIKNLHSAGFAHHDIRLENVCFSNSPNAVLIDMDRSSPANGSYSKYAQFGNSTMYPVHGIWTNTQIDWRQFGLLLYSIIENVDDYHQTSVPKVDDNGFLEKLFYRGELDESLVVAWVDNNRVAID